MKKNRIRLGSLVVVFVMLLSLLGSGTSIAGEPDADQVPVATVKIEPGAISWKPRVENGGLVLTIGGPGDFYFQREYQAGAHPTFKPDDGRGSALQDGVYNYELLILPAEVISPTKYDEAQRGLAPPEGAAEALVQSGSFSILNGGFVTQDVVEEGDDRGDPAQWELNDVLHYDDVIITGSLCTGFDCEDGESFGLDTYILKEHNLRIYFNDTSYSASFPTNNWRITINDSTNGGASYFSIDDVDDGTSIFKIEAGAPRNSLYVEDYGRVGLGTSTPVVELHIKDSDTPTVRLEQDSSGGWTAQTWDVAGNESNFFIRDATNGSKLPFRIQPSTPSSTLCLKSDGYVGIGTWSPAYPLELETTDKDAVFVAQRTDGATAMIAGTSQTVTVGSWSNHPLSLIVNGAPKMYIDTTGYVGIGTITPEQTLHIASGGIKFPDGSVQTAAAGAGLWSSSGDDIYREIGNVGVGTNYPGYPLEVERTDTDAIFVAERTDGATAQVGAGLNVAHFGSQSPHPVEIRVHNEPGIVISPTLNVGIGVENPTHLLDVGTAYCDGTNWVDASSREYKTDIESLTAEEATAAIEALNPIKFHYKTDLEEQSLGFIAEDVPDLVATKDGKGLSSMEIVAALTRVVQEQQKTISELVTRVAELETKWQESEARNASP